MTSSEWPGAHGQPVTKDRTTGYARAAGGTKAREAGGTAGRQKTQGAPREAVGENGNRRTVNAKEGSRPAVKSKLSTGGLVGLHEPNSSTSGLRVDSNNGLTPVLRERHAHIHSRECASRWDHDGASHFHKRMGEERGREGVGIDEVADSMVNRADGVGPKRRAPTQRGARAHGNSDANLSPREGETPKNEVPERRRKGGPRSRGQKAHRGGGHHAKKEWRRREQIKQNRTPVVAL